MNSITSACGTDSSANDIGTANACGIVLLMAFAWLGQWCNWHCYDDGACGIWIHAEFIVCAFMTRVANVGLMLVAIMARAKFTVLCIHGTCSVVFRAHVEFIVCALKTCAA